MKKLFTLLILIGGFVCTASADDYIISGDAAITNNNHNWWWQDNDNKLTETTTPGIYTLVVEGCELLAKDGDNNKYGFKVKVFEDAWNDETTFPESNYEIHVNYTGTYTLIYYVDIANKNIRVLAQPELRWNLGNNGEGNWDWLLDDDSKFTKDGDYGWNFEVSSDDFTGDFSFRIFSGVFQKQAYPSSQDLAMSYGCPASTSAYFFDNPGVCSWKLTKPSYTFDKVVIHAVYKPFDTTNSADYGQWEVSADAYISKTIGETGYATFGSNANVDFSKAIPVTANTNFTAYKGKVQSGGSITYLETSTLYGGEGALLVGDAGTYSIPVSADASADTEHNDFKAVDQEQKVAQSNGAGKTRYILTKKIDNNNDAQLGFYKVNSEGSWCAANTAYLETSISPAGSREYFPLLFETSGVENIKNDLTESNGTVYDLQGRRVINPKKGLYIVNGKKVIM